MWRREQAQFEPLVAIWRACAGESADSPWTALVDAHLSRDGRILVPVRKLAALAGQAATGRVQCRFRYASASCRL